MKLLINQGSKKKIIAIFIETNNSGLTGLTSNDLVCYRYRDDDGETGGIQLPLHDGTRGTWSPGGFVEKDPVNMPGIYELGLDNAGLLPGSDSVFYVLKGDNITPIRAEIQLIDFGFAVKTKPGKKKSKKKPKKKMSLKMMMKAHKKKKKPKKKMSLKMMMKARKKKKKPKKKMSLKMMMKAHKKKKKPKKKMSLKMMKAHKKKKKPKKKMSLKMMKAHKKMSKTRPGQKPDTGPMSKVKPLPKKKKPASKKSRRMPGQKPDTRPKHRKSKMSKSKMSKKMSKSKMSKKMSKSKMSKKMSKSKMSKKMSKSKMSKKPKMLMQMKQMMMMPSPSPSPSPMPSPSPSPMPSPSPKPSPSSTHACEPVLLGSATINDYYGNFNYFIIDTDNHYLYVLNSSNQGFNSYIYKINYSLAVTNTYTMDPSTPGAFTYPNFLTLDKTNNLLYLQAEVSSSPSYTDNLVGIDDETMALNSNAIYGFASLNESGIAINPTNGTVYKARSFYSNAFGGFRTTINSATYNFGLDQIFGGTNYLYGIFSSPAKLFQFDYSSLGLRNTYAGTNSLISQVQEVGSNVYTAELLLSGPPYIITSYFNKYDVTTLALQQSITLGTLSTTSLLSPRFANTTSVSYCVYAASDGIHVDRFSIPDMTLQCGIVAAPAGRFIGTVIDQTAKLLFIATRDSASPYGTKIFKYSIQ